MERRYVGADSREPGSPGLAPSASPDFEAETSRRHVSWSIVGKCPPPALDSRAGPHEAAQSRKRPGITVGGTASAGPGQTVPRSPSVPVPPTSSQDPSIPGRPAGPIEPVQIETGLLGVITRRFARDRFPWTVGGDRPDSNVHFFARIEIRSTPTTTVPSTSPILCTLTPICSEADLPHRPRIRTAVGTSRWIPCGANQRATGISRTLASTQSRSRRRARPCVCNRCTDSRTAKPRGEPERSPHRSPRRCRRCRLRSS